MSENLTCKIFPEIRFLFSKAHCKPAASVDDHDAPWKDNYALFDPEFTLSYQKCEDYGTMSLFNNKLENQKIVYDFGCPAAYSGVVTLRNTQNANFKDRLVNYGSISVIEPSASAVVNPK